MKKLYFLILLIVLICLGCAKKEESSGVKKILIPKTPSGIATYLAVKDNPAYQVEFYLNHSKANAKFLSNKADYLVTGVSVANNFAKQATDFKLVCSLVDNLTYLVSNHEIDSIEDIAGKTIYFPFKNAPMEVMFTAIANKHNLQASRDYNVKYLAIQSSVQLLKQGNQGIVFLPEPFATIATKANDLNINLSLDELYRSAFPDNHACQVVLLTHDKDMKKVKELTANIEAKTKAIINNQINMQDLNEYPNFEKFSAQTIQRTIYHFSSGNYLNSNLDTMFKNIAKDNKLADYILELD